MLHSQEKLTPEQKQMARRRRILQGRAAQGICILAAFAAISLFAAGWLLLRQDRTFSDSENRMLAQKPAPTLASLADGSFAGGIERWYADQFPGRDLWITADLTFQRALGVREMNGVYLGADGYLLEAPAQEDAAQLGQTEAAICAFAAQHPDIRLTAAIVPNAWGVLSEKLPAGAPVEDQKALIDAIDQAMPDVRTANLTEALRSRRSEPLYYRTDHHWTSLGAYYAYCAWRGIEPNADEWTQEVLCDNFHGTTWNKVPLPSVPAEEITAWYKHANRHVAYNDGQYETDSIYERQYLSGNDQYAVFLNSNQAQTVISGSGQSGKLLLIKDSYGNTFSQFPVEDYAEVHVLDLRFFKGNVVEYAKENSITDALVLYGTQNFVSDTALSAAVSAIKG